MNSLSEVSWQTPPITTSTHAAEHDFRVRVYPASEPNGTVLVWLHGGAFMFGDARHARGDEIARQLARARHDGRLAGLHARARSTRSPALPVPEPVEGMPSPGAVRRRARRRPARARRTRSASLQAVAAFDWARAHAARLRGAGRARRARRSQRRRQPRRGRRAAAARPAEPRGPLAQVLVYPVLHAVLPDARRRARGDPRRAAAGPDDSRRRRRARSTRTTSAAPRPTSSTRSPGGHDVRGAAPRR